jgi:RecJ-like exonuclease
VKEYKLVGPAENVSNADAKCPACPGDGKRVQPGSIPETCSVCGGTGKIPGLAKQVNDAAAEGWVVSAAYAVGTQAHAHAVWMERDKQP